MSSRDITKLVPRLVDLYCLFLEECHRQGLKFVVTCTTRTKEEQAELVRAGKSRTMKSKHLDGKAFDIAVIKNGKVSWDFEDYKPYGKIGESVGLAWGGNWKTFKDGPHFELREG